MSSIWSKIKEKYRRWILNALKGEGEEAWEVWESDFEVNWFRSISSELVLKRENNSKFSLLSNKWVLPELISSTKLIADSRCSLLQKGQKSEKSGKKVTFFRNRSVGLTLNIIFLSADTGLCMTCSFALKMVGFWVLTSVLTRCVF